MDAHRRKTKITPDDGLDLDDVASFLLDAQEESMLVEPRVPC
jgi:hypothetical protein